MDSLLLGLTLLVTTPLVPAAVGGVSWGVLGGALPGISPSITMALVLPLTYGMDPGSAIVLLASTYVGAEYGGSIPAILINTPGTNAAAATVLDGYAMQRQGRGGEALGISLYSGVLGGLFGLTMLVMLTEPLARVALAFTPMAYFALGILGLSIIASLSGESLLKGLAAGVLGLMVATVGSDPVSGVPRFVFGRPELLDGIAPILIMVGLFAVSELYQQASAAEWRKTAGTETRLRFPDGALRRRLIKPQMLGATIGTLEGVMPGAGGTIASFMSYNEARRWSRHKEEFGHGSPEGVAAPETANNTVAATALVPVLSFGIPGSNSAAILLGGLLVHGLIPGPRLFEENADVVVGLYTGLFVANISLLFIGLLILPVCLWLVNRPKAYLMAFIYALIFSGVYSIDHSLFDVALVLVVGVAGVFMRLAGLPMLPAVLGVVLGYMIESNYRRSLVLSGGDHGIFIEDAIALGLLSTAMLFIAGSLTTRAYLALRRRNPSPGRAADG
jgi:putative tricarboxylic transport membrane protein